MLRPKLGPGLGTLRGERSGRLGTEARETGPEGVWGGEGQEGEAGRMPGSGVGRRSIMGRGALIVRHDSA